MILKISRGLKYVLLLILWGGFQPQVAEAQKEASSQESLAELYAKAVKDALNPEPGEVSRQLVPISLENGHLIWEAFDGKPYVLMVSWVSDASYYQHSLEKKQPYNTGSYSIWVSAAPQVQKRCSWGGFGGQDLDLRLRQLLGLPPRDPEKDLEKKDFVEFWVRPQDLFRPCPDNEVEDRSCGLDLPAKVPPQYRLWFNSLRARQYFQSSQPTQNEAYPWTQLGYTYDWSPTNRGHVGPSEFVIRQNSEVRIKGIVPTGKYCGRE